MPTMKGVTRTDFTGWEYISAPHQTETDRTFYWRLVGRHFRNNDPTTIDAYMLDRLDWRIHPETEC